MEQSYICTDENMIERECYAREICDHKPATFRVNTQSVNYVENWVQEMDLMCVDRATVNFIIMAYYLAFCVAGACLW